MLRACLKLRGANWPAEVQYEFFGPNSFYQKNPFSVRKIRVRNSGAGNGCANFMDTWKKCVLSEGKPMSVKFPFFGGGVWGGSADFIFMGARIFPNSGVNF